jgi:hypothetical protein
MYAREILGKKQVARRKLAEQLGDWVECVFRAVKVKCKFVEQKVLDKERWV